MKPLVIWDWNGTLLDDVAVSLAIFNRLREESGHVPVSLEQFRDLHTYPIIQMYTDSGFVFDDLFTFDLLAEQWQVEYTEKMGEVMPFDDAVRALETLTEKGFQQIIVSAAPQEILQRQIEQFSLNDHFHTVSGHPDLRAESKVERAIEIARGSGVELEQMVVVGDTSHDAEVARGIGCHCILVARGYEMKKKLESHGFPVVETLSAAAEKIIAWLLSGSSSPL